MKALVLAGGTGSRLRPITLSAAKQLIPVANKPVLFYALESLVAAGVTDIGMIVGDTADEIRAAVGDGGDFGARVTYIHQERPLGLAHAVLVARPWLGEEDFVMYLGDNFLFGRLDGHLERFRADRPAAGLLLTRVDNPGAFGVARVDPGGRVLRLEEKPRRPESDLALVGVYLFTPEIHEAARAIRPAGSGELEITDAIQWLIDRGRRVDSTVISGYWKDTGTLDDLLEVNRSVLEGVRPRVEGEVDDDSEIVGRVRIDPGARVVRSRVVGPVVIGPGSTISDSYVGPFTSIAEGCRLEDAEIEFSIVLAGAGIRGVGRVEKSLIGKEARVERAENPPKAHRLLLGDHSRVRIAP
ncbi:glucose-1-phosphate thymidylyltransferase [Streptomyces calidiresistens]|uniref:Glucose-1-phosphate thymidylyltransferase n=1 Tax=Streptomyces calidiresistens TaxID=1485586 RepID=A0A7W3XVL2_9ACTN|nr:glucose-1-phosphate thymidylyltransferase [Streptomyces calidiresistens]MBB0228894.1 glucose-1-phosphate thymidylyltransferase [Streptomyces calidiresistens]